MANNSIANHTITASVLLFVQRGAPSMEKAELPSILTS